MKTLSTFCLLIIATSLMAQQQYPIQAIPFQRVQLLDKFWAPRVETVRKVTIPHTFRKNLETGRVKNFTVAASTTPGSVCSVFPFDDSDLYKIIEGAAYAVQTKRDPKLEASVDSLVAIIKAAQEPDGYLYTWRTIVERRNNPERLSTDTKGANLDWLAGPRWAKEDDLSHELYNAGHLYEAAVAWFNATGKRNLLDIALKNAALIDQTFGPGKLQKAPGHEEIELGLVKLYQTTGEKRWLNLAKFFIDVRGYGEAYSQNHLKVKDQRDAQGHAVRLAYLYAAVADVTALTGTNEYQTAMKAVWDDIVGKQIYITGGVGATGSNEGFGGAYDLPNYSAYCETCSSIAFVNWTQKMFQLTGDSRYLDVMELTLYNALNAGISLSGDHFFYPNPLESRKNVARTEWFSCACCPPNLARFYSSMAGLFYAQKGNELYLNMFAASKTTFETTSGKSKIKVDIQQESDYPWSGIIKVKVNPATPNTFAIKVRIPGWANGEAIPLGLYSFVDPKVKPIVFKVNGKIFTAKTSSGYATLERKWQKGDVIEFELPMEVQRIAADPRVKSDELRYALKSGPLVYCIEGKDQPDDRVLNMVMSEETPFSLKFDPNLLGGQQTINFNGSLVTKKTAERSAELKPLDLKAIPYYAWANRGRDNMLVWLPYDLKVTKAIAQPTLANRSTLSASPELKGALTAASDQSAPKTSGDGESTFVHWWPHFGTEEWLQYTFPQAEKVSKVKVYWFDDEVIGGGCRIPKSWRITYLDNGVWKPVKNTQKYATQKDAWNEVSFEGVSTTAIRIELVLQNGVSAGVHEWEVE
jgi:uncharacterized protein